MNNQKKLLQNYMIENKIDVVYLDNPTTVAYFTNFESNPHERIVAYLVTQNGEFLFVPSLEKNEAQHQSNVEQIYTYSDSENPWEIIANEVIHLQADINCIFIDESTMTVERFHLLSQALLDQGPIGHTHELADISDFIEEIRVVKTEEEIKKMEKAGELADQALEIGFNALKPGITELEVVALIEMEMKKLGVSEMSFGTLVLFGDHAASPHGNPGDRQLKENEFVLFDLGVIYNGYASDVTRTVAFGEVNAEMMEIYDVVLEAQLKAQEAVKPGIKAGELDVIARKVIEDAGYGEYFMHRLGHGIGKTAHEFPSVNAENEIILEPGMCFSIEPGIYIPGFVGVRIEDCVYVTEDGSQSFTHLSKDFKKIKA